MRKLKINKKNRGTVILIISSFILGLILALLYLFLARDNNTIVFTQEGFNPQTMTIQKGETVTFFNKSEENFWPASNVHPAHSIYSEFDPKRGLGSGEKWSFTFNRAGKWRFHDHLHPNFEGIITVLEKGQKSDMFEKIITQSECNAKPEREKQQCFQELIYQKLEQEGVSSAFEILAELFATDPVSLGDCHGITHTIGKKAYHLFSENKKVALSDKSSYCGYGFYHGFMEELLHVSGDVQEARDFCDYAQVSLAVTTSDAGGACYHGIGHGLVEDEPDQKLWGNAQGIIDQGLRLCDSVSNSQDRLFRCASGVFNAYEILATGNKYGLSHDKDHLFVICEAQEEKYKDACYPQLVVPLLGVISGDYKKGVQIIDSQIQNDTYAKDALVSLIVEMSRNNPDLQAALEICRSLSPRLQIVCVTGFAEGFMKYGPPQQEYVKALEVCSSSELKENEKNACYERILSILRIWYTAEKSSQICMSVPQQYRWSNCQY